MAVENERRYLIVYFKKEKLTVTKKTKVVTSSTQENAMSKLAVAEEVPNRIVKESFGENQHEGIKYINVIENGLDYE